MKANKYMAVEDRFWVSVEKTDGCWNWTSGTDTGGYSKLVVDGRNMSGHRYSFRLHGGVVPKGMFLDHICHNRRCVNPAHLRIASRQQNNAHAKIRKDNTTGFKGVTKERGRFRAQIKFNKRLYYLGSYRTAEEAAMAYAYMAQHLNGDFAFFEVRKGKVS